MSRRVGVLCIVLLPALAACASTDLRSQLNNLKRPAQDSAQVELGKRLFFDTRLSAEKNISCATCHDPEMGFGDGKVKSPGTHRQLQPRHTPSLYNLAWSSSFFWDGRAATLEEQVLQPIQNPREMDLDLDTLKTLVAGDVDYARRFREAFPKKGVSTKSIARALAAYVRSLVALDSPFDRYLRGQGTLTESALRGMRLFKGRAQCERCHKGILFTDHEFHNTGVKDNDPGRSAVRRLSPFGFGTRGMTPYPFLSHNQAFKTPGLRNVALSAPYFHDGSRETLLSVVEFYNAGGDVSSQGKSSFVRALGLSAQDKEDLVSFLHSLTSEPPASTRSASLQVTRGPR